MGLRRKSPTMESEVVFPGERVVDPRLNQERLRQATIQKPSEWGTRHSLAFMGFLGFVCSYAMRVNLSIAIVSMVHHVPKNDSILDVCPNLLPNVSKVVTSSSGLESARAASLSAEESEAFFEDKNGEFFWDSEDQGIILGSFFWGYILTQVPGGMLAERIGKIHANEAFMKWTIVKWAIVKCGKWLFGIGMLITALFSLITPWAARSGKAVLIIVRIIQGLGEGVTNPSMHALLARWVPPLERSKIGAFVYAGAQIGTVITLPICGMLLNSKWGWPSVFYVFGGLGIIWFIFWCIYVFNEPSQHPRIDANELQYIQQSIGHQTSKHRVPTPWKKICTSLPVFAILCAQTGHGWGLYTLLTEMPTYMKTVLHFNIKANSLLSGLAYFGMWVVSISASWLADFMRERGASTTKVRKLFNSIAHWIPAIGLILASYSGCNRFWSVLFLYISVGISGCAWASFQINHIDIAPNHAGVLMGITNGIANLCGIGAPYVAGLVTKNGVTIENWRIIFFIAAAVYFFDNIVYILFASGEEQEWNRDSLVESKHEDDVDTSDRQPLLDDSSRSLSHEVSGTSRSIP